METESELHHSYNTRAKLSLTPEPNFRLATDWAEAL